MKCELVTDCQYSILMAEHNFKEVNLGRWKSAGILRSVVF
jgi:hypothetical protein